MDDLISRQAAIDAMCELMHHWFEDPKDEVREINRELGKLPPSQSERKKGVWVQTGMGPQCSNCWYKCQTTGTPQFCPSCGAEMQ